MCDNSLEYLFKILQDDKISTKEKQQVVDKIMSRFLDLKTYKGRVNTVICIVAIALILSQTNFSSFYIFLQSLIKAVREGKISKVVARAILRKMKKNGIPVDPEFLEVVNDA